MDTKERHPRTAQSQRPPTKHQDRYSASLRATSKRTTSLHSQKPLERRCRQTHHRLASTYPTRIPAHPIRGFNARRHAAVSRHSEERSDEESIRCIDCNRSPEFLTQSFYFLNH